MTCVEIQDRLSAEIDGELAAPEAEEVHRHLGACAACRRRSALLRDAREAFRAFVVRTTPSRSITAAALAATLLLAVAAGWGRWRPPAPPALSRGGGAPAAQLLSVSLWDRGTPPDAIDCGRPGATVCVVDEPCGDGQCDASPSVDSH
jgi:anti-sigma factor RsiW